MGVSIDKNTVFRHWFRGMRKVFSIIIFGFCSLVPLAIYWEESHKPMGDIGVFVVALVICVALFTGMVFGLIYEWRNYWKWVKQHPETWNKRI